MVFVLRKHVSTYKLCPISKEEWLRGTSKASCPFHIPGVSYVGICT